MLNSWQRRVGVAILCVGFVVALIIFLRSASPLDSQLQRPEDSKQYLRQMQVYGGTANVLATELREWFEGLWHGRKLAYTVACLTMLLAGLVVIGMTPLQTTNHHGPGENHAEPGE